MSNDIRKRMKRIAAALAAATAAFGMSCLVACDAKPVVPEYPFDDTDIVQKEYDHTVTIIGTKTQTVYLKTGETLEQSKPTNTPKKSGERFVGWFADGEQEPYDWTKPVSADVTIRARFEKVAGLKVPSGVAFPKTDGGITTGANDTLAVVGTFENGSFSCNVTPVSDGNDCGVVFGLRAPETENFWENEGDTAYYTVLINKDGILLFARVNPWSDVTPGVQLANYDPEHTYNIKIGYDAEEGYCAVSVDGARMMSVELGELAGNGVGYRAQIVGTEFGAMTFDPADVPVRPSKDVGDYRVKNGYFKQNADGSMESTENLSLAILAEKQQSDRLSFTMTLGEASDSGIVFGLTDTGDANYFEQSYANYYFFFVDASGNARLTRFAGSWNEPFGANVNVKSDDLVYRMDVLIDGNKFDCYVNGVRCFTVTDAQKLAGTRYGIRAQKSGVKYVEHDVADKHAVILDGANVALQFVADGATVVRPEDPVRDGYRFDGWYASGATAEYDFDSPVTADMTITAKFSDDAEVDHTVPSGSAEKIQGGGYKTLSNNTLILTKHTFEQGSVTATVKPGEPNDCGLVFGIDPTKSNAFEDTPYMTVLLNRDGVLFLSAIPWRIVKETRIQNFDASKTYTVKVAFNAADGYCVVSLDGQEMLTATLDALYGNGLGYRSAAAGVEFGEYTVDANDIPTRPSKEVGEYTVRCGGYALDGADGRIKSGATNSLAVLTNENMSDRISITMSAYAGGDCGIVFGLTDNNGDEYFEGHGENYYFLFITNGNVRLSRISNGAWSEFQGIEKNMKNDGGTYRMEVVVNRSAKTIACFINGKKAFEVKDDNLLEGTAFGLRSNKSVEYEFNDVADKHYATVFDGAATTLTFVNDGDTLAKPTDPEKGGYEFKGWYADGKTENGEFVWTSGVTGDVNIEAVFEEISGNPYRIINGNIDDSGERYKTTQTAGGALMILNDKQFAEGSLEATIKPGTRNDCGLVFGANVPESGADWENFDYFTVLINANGTILFARVHGWGVMASSPVLEQKYGVGDSFPVTEEYKVKVEYKDGFARVYAAKVGDEYMLAATTYIGALKGGSIGFRAAAANVEFGKTVTVDTAAAPQVGEVNSDLTFVKRAGADMTVDAENKAYTSTAGGTVYTSDNVVLQKGGMLSATMNVKDAAARNECNGIIFGAPSDRTSGDFWENEGDNYYFFFIADDGVVRLSTLRPWAENITRITSATVDVNVDHTLTVSWDGNGVTCFVDGVMYFCGDNVKYGGGVFGWRVQTSGIVYKDIKIVDYSLD